MALVPHDGRVVADTSIVRRGRAPAGRRRDELGKEGGERLCVRVHSSHYDAFRYLIPVGERGRANEPQCYREAPIGWFWGVK
jgi:hypothetical protein